MTDTRVSPYLTTTEAAAIIRRTPDYVMRQCAAGNLRATKVGAWRIHRDDLDAFMRGPEPTPAARPPRRRAR